MQHPNTISMAIALAAVLWGGAVVFDIMPWKAAGVGFLASLGLIWCLRIQTKVAFEAGFHAGVESRCEIERKHNAGR